MQTALRRYFRHGLFPQLMVFEAVARLGSVTRAAEELHLAQPTVSTQLAKLSDALGVPLIEWRRRELCVTPAGCALYAACGELASLFGRIEGRLALLRCPSPAAELITIMGEGEAGNASGRHSTRVQRG
jgi:LysR family transcriptional regulator, low CO2-responsive transcriptional regulator